MTITDHGECQTCHGSEVVYVRNDRSPWYASCPDDLYDARPCEDCIDGRVVCEWCGESPAAPSPTLPALCTECQSEDT
jgi:hypothetical protein